MAGNENGGELLQDAVCRTLAIEMLDGKWPAGESLTLEDVQNRFGISRTVAREVAKTLESMGAVTVRRRVGLVARPFSDWQALNHQVIEWRLHSTQRERQLSSLTELRLAVEPAAALADTIATVLRGRVELGKYPMKPKPAALDAHDAVADAIAKGDPERARKAMFDIVDEVARALNFF